MSVVETVRGPVESSDLGRTLMHEHVFVLTSDVQANFPQEWGSEDARVADAVTRLRALAAIGVRTIIDPTVIGLGRYIPRIERVAAQVPELNIVVATGAYTYTDVPFFFTHRPDVGAGDPMVAMFTADIVDGIGGTGVRAGLLKCAIDEPGLTPGVERILRAVGQVHLTTGTPITVHTHPGSHTGLHVARILVDELGVDPGKVVLGHSGDTTDADHLSALAETGFVLGMDRFGINLATSFEARADIVVELCRRGFAEQMVLSHDAACYIDWVDPQLMAFLPQWNYLHIEREVLPYLREHGVTEQQITAMLIDTPRRYFEPLSAGQSRR
jgi:phosphotriesterase-related protein